MTREDLIARANPGSDEAIALGCKCPVWDNARGQGWMGTGSFWVNGDCPIHAPRPRDGQFHVLPGEGADA